MTDEKFEASVPELRDGFLWEPIPEGCLIFEETTGKLITLNSSAEVVLTHCDGEMNVAEICRTLESDFQIPYDETRSVLKRLLDEGVISLPADA